MSVDDDDALILEWHDRPWEMAMPPAMHPAPAAVLPPLEEGTVVTVRLPGPVWVIDELTVVEGPVEEGGESYYELLPRGENAAGTARREGDGLPEGQVRCMTQMVRAADVWVYRDETGERTIDDLPQLTGAEWLDRVGDGSEPPVRRPRPTRELPLMTGHRARVPNGQGWGWYRVLGEPIDVDGRGDLRLPLMPEAQWWMGVYANGPTQTHPDAESIIWAPVHICWTY